ncbi:GNAT family N-acetyltransferase [uncultured Ruegeria sp.]|uniref:GNAT family N-acetyltransferase n=1 Tax=uncultured Ruegeria sp. TaxID=259304 RepID=UPI00261EC5DB|nr:GNAT family N-acetyltransferase [uncultured Ruegeria sp.]
MPYTLEVLDQFTNRAEIEALLREYLDWAVPLFNQQNNLDVDVNVALAGAFSDLAMFLPPDGCTVLARDALGVANAVGFSQKIRPGAVEVKRLFVRPAARGEGLGQRLILKLVDEARKAGHSEMYLDTADFMSSAHTLYRSLGFREIDGYPEAEHQRDVSPHVIYMVLALD